MQILLDVSEFQSVAQLDSLLRNADDEIVGVIIKATQGLTYRDALLNAFAGVCENHDTPWGGYDFLTNDQIAAQQNDYNSDMATVRYKPSIMTMLDAEGSYDKFAEGVAHWAGPKMLYAQLSNMPKYTALDLPKLVAQYDENTYYRPSQDEIDNYRAQGYVAWQWTSNYMGLNQDAYVLLAPLAKIRMV